ncbi:hypothetical protein PHLGIDRAFT_15542 [Phlebiopsis gigantea 11061_1 CR5-6]|uniref:Uncharacterized protein n=1 Tax=Phlebiopsis gigantea (strain 11061_1 CR5-6) TaxID=745531 RepID=A0A0C3PEP3_PHLG1|nr:hypothetical protein PHLGIDRAFT_15542 [Phlebiopsis gigantea 11061_1 CR5-6]
MKLAAPVGDRARLSSSSAISPRLTVVCVNLASETISHVLFCLTRVPDSLEFSLRLFKRQLGTLSLVCRYWAKRVRPQIFNPISIPFRKDLDQLLEFLDYNGLVKPSTGPWATPWLHHLQRELDRSRRALKHNSRAFPLVITLQNSSVIYPQSDAHLWLTEIAIQDVSGWTPCPRRRRPRIEAVNILRSGSASHQARLAFYPLWHLRKDLSFGIETWTTVYETMTARGTVPNVLIKVGRNTAGGKSHGLGLLLFEWLVRAILERKMLTKLYTDGRLDVQDKIPLSFRMPFRRTKRPASDNLSLRELLVHPSKHNVNGRFLHLDVYRRLHLLACENTVDSLRLFQSIAQHSTPSQIGTPVANTTWGAPPVASVALPIETVAVQHGSLRLNPTVPASWESLYVLLMHFYVAIANISISSGDIYRPEQVVLSTTHSFTMRPAFEPAVIEAPRGYGRSRAAALLELMRRFPNAS